MVYGIIESMKKTIKKVFYPQSVTNHRPYFWHPLNVSFFAMLIFLISGTLFLKDLNIEKDSLLGDIKSGVLIAFTNQERINVGELELSENELLDNAAQLKAQDMADKGYFAHTTPEGFTPWYWFTQAGYQYQRAGENLAVNFDDSKDVVDAWMNSPTHKANIVKDGYTEIGIGIAKGKYKGKNATFVVQLFATPKSLLQSSQYAFAIQKESQIPSNETVSVKGAQITNYSRATVFELLTTESTILVSLLFILIFIIVGALYILVSRTKKHSFKQIFSMLILGAALILACVTLYDFFRDITIIV